MASKVPCSRENHGSPWAPFTDSVSDTRVYLVLQMFTVTTYTQVTSKALKKGKRTFCASVIFEQNFDVANTKAKRLHKQFPVLKMKM